MFKSSIPYVIILFIINLLLSNAIGSKKDMSILFSRSTILIFFYSAYLCYNSIYYMSLEKGISILGGLFHITSLSAIFNQFILIIGFIILLLTGYYARKIWKVDQPFDIISKKNLLFKNQHLYNIKNIFQVINKESYQYKVVEYGLIILFVIIGAIFLMTTNDLVSIFLAIELQSYGLYLICCLWRDSEKAISAGLTYFLLGALSSCLILLGTVLLYVYSGTSNIDIMYSISNLFTLCDYSFISEKIQSSSTSLNVAFTLISVGFLFKISASPFHFWSPDVYDQIPTIVTTFVAIAGKISILIFLLELVHYENGIVNLNNNSWTYCLLISSLLSLIVGTILGLKETRIKRLLAFSTISHLGFMLLGICINSLQSIQAFIFYLIQYSITNLNAFFFILMIGYSLYYHVHNKKEDLRLSDINNSPVQLLNDLKGYFIINPVISLSFSITIFSFVGIPPLIGFFAKQMILVSALNSGYIFLSLVAILTSVIGAVYYLGIIKYMFFDNAKFEFIVSLKHLIENYITKVNNDDKIKNKNTKQYQLILESIPNKTGLFELKDVVLSSSLTLTTSFLTLIILLFMFTPEESLNLSNIVSLLLFRH